MRLGISATSTIFPKRLRNLLRPVKERVIQEFLAVADHLGRVLQPTLLVCTNGEPHRPSGSPAGRGGVNQICTRSPFSSPANLLTSARLARLRPRAAF